MKEGTGGGGVDAGPGSNSREAVEGDRGGGWWLCDECESGQLTGWF